MELGPQTIGIRTTVDPFQTRTNVALVQIQTSTKLAPVPLLNGDRVFQHSVETAGTKLILARVITPMLVHLFYVLSFMCIFLISSLQTTWTMYSMFSWRSWKVIRCATLKYKSKLLLLLLLLHIIIIIIIMYGTATQLFHK